MYTLEAFSQGFITLRDEEFVGPDKKLMEELTRRSQLPHSDEAALQALLNKSTARPPRRRATPSLLRTKQELDEYIRAYVLRTDNTSDITNMTSTTGTAASPPTTDNTPIDPLYDKTHDLITFLIYNVIQRLEDLKPIMAKYEGDARIRVGHVFCKLDKWRLDLLATYVSAERFINRTVSSHLYCYEKILAKNIDITYTIEYLLNIENNIQSQLDDMDQRELRDLQKMYMKKFKPKT